VVKAEDSQEVVGSDPDTAEETIHMSHALHRERKAEYRNYHFQLAPL